MQRSVPRTLEGKEGPPGPRGSSGGVGPQGIQGIQGIQGPAGSSGTGIASGVSGAVQFSDGTGGFLDNSNIYIIDNSDALLPYNALVLDSSSNSTGLPVSSLVLAPPTGLMPQASHIIRDGTIGYFQIDGTDKRDFYGYDPSGAGSPHYQWQSLTKLTTPALPTGGAIQYNNANVFDASSSLIFNTSVNPPQLLITGAMNVTDTSGGDSSTIQCANVAGTGGVEILSTVKCDITGNAHAPINLETLNGDINCNITGVPGSMLFKNALGPISLDAGMSLDLSANNFIQLRHNTSNIMYATQTNETFLTMGESDINNNYGIFLRATGISGEGVGLKTFIDTTNISAGQKGRATLQMNAEDASTPFGPIPRIYMQSSATNTSQGGYRALFAAGSSNIPTPTDIGDGDALKFGEFYVGQARMTGGEHICFNLDSGGFGNFNIAGGTHLCITDGSENKTFARLRKDGGGKLELMDTTGGFDNIILDGNNTTIDCGANGGGIGIVNVRDNAGTILTKINGGDISANTVASGTVTATTVTGDTLTDGTLSIASGSITGGINAQFSKKLSLTQGLSPAGPAVSLTGGTGGDLYTLTPFQATTPTDVGISLRIPNRIGTGSTTRAAYNIRNASASTAGVCVTGTTTTSVDTCIILDCALQGGLEGPGKTSAIYLGWQEETILEPHASWPHLADRAIPQAVGGSGQTIYPVLLLNGPTLITGDTASPIFGWDFTTETQEDVVIGYDTTSTKGLDVRGRLTKSTGSFKIDHPDPKKNGHTQSFPFFCRVADWWR